MKQFTGVIGMIVWWFVGFPSHYLHVNNLKHIILFTQRVSYSTIITKRNVHF